jgi:hypothetical protein
VVAPFPWSALPRVDRRAAALLRTVPGTFAAVLEGPALEARLADPSAGVVRIQTHGVRGFVVVPGTVARRIAQMMLGGPDEILAPRPLTEVEKALLVARVATMVDGHVEGSDLGGPQVPGTFGGRALVVDVAVGVGTAAMVLPIELIVRPTRLALADLGGAGWLDAVQTGVAVVVARARLGPAELAGLAVRDVVVAERVGRRGEAELAVARGRYRAALVPGTGRVTVLAGYERWTMDETLADDASLDVAVAVGDLRMSVRSLLELRAGQVLELGKPVGTEVELRLGARVIGRGELVDVDGQVGVRVLSLDRTL